MKIFHGARLLLLFCEVLMRQQQLTRMPFCYEIRLACPKEVSIEEERSSMFHSFHALPEPTQRQYSGHKLKEPFSIVNEGKVPIARFLQWRHPKLNLIYISFQFLSFGFDFIVKLAIADQNFLNFSWT